MALNHLVFVGTALLSLAFFSGSEAGEVGVCYGMLSSQLMPPPEVVQLLQKNGITKVRLYDANAGALSALANSGIKVKVSLPNANLVDAAGSTSYARQWVESNVKAYVDGGTVIDGVDVGNEVFHQAPELTPQLLPAMKNIQAALASMGLADAVKVMTPIALDALKEPSWPPSVGEFRDDLAQSVLGPMIDFLDQTGSHLAFNIYPYFAYKRNPTIDLDYVLFRPNKGNRDAGTGLIYYNMFDAMLDAVFHAEEKLRSSRGHASRSRSRMLAGTSSTVTGDESGHAAAASTVRRVASDDIVAGQKSVGEDSTANAQTYNSNLISKVLRGIGTPYRPNANINVYIFSLFNEDLKTGGDDETHFGLFYPDGTPVYKVDFGGPSAPLALPLEGLAGARRTRPSGTGGSRMRSTMRAATGRTAAPSSPASRVTSPTPWSRTRPTPSIPTTRVRAAPAAPATSMVPPPLSSRNRQASATRARGAGAWRTRRSETRGFRRRWTTPAATARTAVPSSPAAGASIPTLRSRTRPTHSTTTTSATAGLTNPVPSAAAAPSSTSNPSLATACSDGGLESSMVGKTTQP